MPGSPELLEPAPASSAPPLPPPPELWLDGRPLFPHAAAAHELRGQHERNPGGGSFYRRGQGPARWQLSDRLGQQPTFTLEEIAVYARHRTAGVVWPGHHHRLSRAEQVLAALTGRGAETLVWEWKRRVLVVGPASDQVREVLGGSACPHEVGEPSSFSEWRTALN